MRAAIFAALLEVGVIHQGLDTLVHPAETLLQPHHVLTIGGEAKMTRLDNAGMHRSDRNLMQPLTFRRKKFVRHGFTCGTLFTERMPHVPEAEIEPRPRVECINRIKTEQITDRAFEPNCRWMTRRNARILSGFTSIADDSDIAGCLVQQCHVDLRLIAPEAEQRAVANCELIDRLPPTIFGHDSAGPWPMCFGRRNMGNVVEQAHDIIPTAGRRFGSRRPTLAACRFRP